MITTIYNPQKTKFILCWCRSADGFYMNPLFQLHQHTTPHRLSQAGLDLWRGFQLPVCSSPAYIQPNEIKQSAFTTLLRR